jgi:hypothetical protein
MTTSKPRLPRPKTERVRAAFPASEQQAILAENVVLLLSVPSNLYVKDGQGTPRPGVVNIV